MALCAVLCAFAVLDSLSRCSVMPLKRSVFDFGVFVRVFIVVNLFNALMSRFRAFAGCACLSLSLGASSRAVRDG